jgi:RNA polymerase sigma-70 factor (ECF subfamily)
LTVQQLTRSNPKSATELAPVNQGQSLQHLCHRLKRSDSRAFEVIFRMFRVDLLRYVGSIIEDAVAAHDLVQDVFTYLWEKRAALQPELPLKPYLYRMARNRALRHLRDERTHTQKHLEIKANNNTSDVDASIDSGVHAKDLVRQLRTWVLELPDRQREAITLSRMHHLSHAEIANLMGVSPRTVNNHIGRALRTLEARLAKVERTPNVL